MSFYYWCATRRSQAWSIPLSVVVLDRHSDLISLRSEEISSIHSLDLADLSSVRDFVSKRLNDVNFICAAMECELVDNVLIVTQESSGVSKYETQNGKVHRVYSHTYTVQEGFAESLFSKQNKKLFKVLNFLIGRTGNLALDIDLDFFTYDHNDDVLVFSENNFNDIFCSDSLIWKVYDAAKLLTVALEPYWSGGPENSNIAYTLLKKYLKVP